MRRLEDETIDGDRVRHRIRDQAVNGVKVTTGCGQEIWRAVSQRHRPGVTLGLCLKPGCFGKM